MEACGPHSSQSDTVSSTSREPKSVVVVPANNGAYRAPKDDGSKLAVALSSGANEESKAKGTARLANLRQTGSSDATSSIVIAAVRQLEQRLECEHRYNERQFQRLERQVEELTKVPLSEGRWAELQGYVDGLAGTVQTLVKRNEEAAIGAPVQVGNASIVACSDNASLTALRMRVDGLEDRQAQADKSRDMQAKEHHQYVAEHFQNLGDRLFETEQGLARISSLAVNSGTSAVEAAPVATERGRRDDLTSTNKDNRHESIEPPEAIAVAKTFEYIHEELANFAARLEAAESAIEASAHSGEDIPSATSSQEFHETEKMQEQEVDELRSQLDERLCELHERLDDLEGRLQDLQVDQDVRQEASHVGEQVFRLAMRMQRLESNGAANGVSIEAARGLHTELGDLSEQLFHLSGRLTHAERGLSGMAEGFDRICEELAHLRSEHTVDRTGSAVEQEAGYEAAERDVNTESEPLHHKVLEMERSHATVAEVVWELRKQVSGLRTSLATLQSSIGGEEIVASSFHSRNASPGSIPS